MGIEFTRTHRCGGGEGGNGVGGAGGGGDDDESTQTRRFILSTKITNTHMQINKTSDMTQSNQQRDFNKIDAKKGHNHIKESIES